MMNRTQLANIFLDDRVRKILAKDKAVKNNGQMSLDLMAVSPVPRNMVVDGVEFNDIHNMQVDMNTPKEVLLARKAELDYAQDVNGRSKLMLKPMQGPHLYRPLLMGNQGMPNIHRPYNPAGSHNRFLEALGIEKLIRERAGAPGQMNLPIDLY
tara:strand:+ start:69 stop:530 length:462 start_codon:yes stop_codon:yes gene_type:complete